VTISALLGLVVFTQCEKSVSLNPWRRFWLRSEVAEQLSPVINQAVAIAIQRQPGVIRAGIRPRKFLSVTITVEIESHSAGIVRETNAAPGNIQDDRARRRIAHARFRIPRITRAAISKVRTGPRRVLTSAVRKVPVP